MTEELDSILTLPAESVPELLRDWLRSVTDGATLASLELLSDGRVVVQVVPGVDPRLVARVRRTIAQHEDVLRRLS